MEDREIVRLYFARDEDAVAISDCILIKVPVGLFLSMLNRNPALARKSLSKIGPGAARGW